MSHETTPPAASENRNNIAAAPDEPSSIEQRIVEVRARISDLGFEIDSEKTGAALAMGGGVFMILLAALAYYDLVSGKAGIWLAVGITRDTLEWIAYVCGITGAALMGLAIARRLRRDRSPEVELIEMEQEYARLIDRKNSMSSD
ncbi:MAG TPA: hypothetical protein VJZ26_05315 [Blastocatellia bacterium]|nr:hypothetical protein [Blastocatellia bacterium]